jgi:hypothetical protein
MKKENGKAKLVLTSAKGNMIQFIRENLILVDDYDLKELYFKVIQKKFYKEYGFYLEANNSGSFVHNELKFKVNDILNYEQLEFAWKEWEKQSGMSEQERNERVKFDSLFNYYYLHIEKVNANGNVEFSLGKNGIGNFLFLMFYVIHGEIHNDYSIENQLVDNYKLRGITWDDESFPHVKVIELGIEMKRLKNGKLIVKGLIDKDLNEIERIRKLVKGL